MLDIEEWKTLSPEAKEFYYKHQDYFDEMLDKWRGFINPVVVIEQMTKNGEVHESKNEIITAD